MADEEEGEQEAKLSQQPSAVIEDVEKGCFGPLRTLILLLVAFFGLVVVILKTFI